MKKFLLSFLCLMTLFAANAAVIGDTYTKVKSVSDLTIDAEYILCYETYAMGAQNGTKYRNCVANGITLDNDNATIASTDVVPFTIVAGTAADTYAFKFDTGYLECTNITNGSVKESTTLAETCNLSISINNGTATIIPTKNSNSNNNKIQCNNAAGQERFTNYKTGTQKNCTLYKKVNVGPVDYTPGFQDVELMAGDTHTLALGDKHPADMIFVSGNDNVATVTDEGVITAVAEGTATISCSWDADSNFNAGETEFTVTITPKVKVVYAPDFQNVTITEGSTLALALGEKHPVILFESSDENVATIDDAGVITALTVGETTISCLWGDADYEDGEAEFTVTVTEAPAYTSAVLLHSTKDYSGDIEFITKANAVPAIIPGVCTFNYTNGACTNDFRPYANSSFTFTPAENVTIEKIVFTDTNDKTPVISVADNNGTLSSAGRTHTWTGASIGEIKFTTTAQIRVEYFEIYYSVQKIDDTKTEVVLSWDAAEVSVKLGEEFNAPALSVSVEDAKDAVRYKSDKPEIASVDEVTGVVTPLADGTATISAYIPENNETYAALNASYVLTVVDPSIVTLTPDFFGYRSSSYNESSATDAAGVTYSAVYSGSSSTIAFNNNNANGGAASGIVVMSNKQGIVIESITLEFSNTGNGVDVYAQNKNFAQLVAGVVPEVDNAEKLNADAAIKENVTLTIGKTAFAIVPANGSVSLKSVAVKYSDDKICVFDAEELTPIFSRSTVSFDENNQAKIEIPNNDLDGVKIYYKHEPSAASQASLMSVDHADFTEAAHNVENGTHDFTINGAGQVTYYGYHEATDTKGVERTFKVLENGTTGVEGVEVDSDDAAVEYFNLQGVRVENPAAGGLYIHKQGSKVTKVIL